MEHLPLLEPDRTRYRLRKERLLRAFSRLLDTRVKSRAPLSIALQRFRQPGWHAHVFGGTIRDLLVRRRPIMPRDVDLVVTNVSIEEIATSFEGYVQRHTRFGGISLNVEGWLVDVWPLHETWGFRSGLVEHPSFSNLPKTTFLNVEAVAVALDAQQGYRRNVYEEQFFDAFDAELVEVNLLPNPFPDLCVVRALSITSVLGFDMGPKLGAFIAEQVPQYSLDHLERVQISHYGHVRVSSYVIRECYHSIRAQLENPCCTRIRLPAGQQRLF